MAGKMRMRSIDEGDFKGKAVLLRIDINSPVDKLTKRIINDNRIRKSVPTIRDLSEQGAKLVLMSHQGDTTDYASLISMHEHANRLSEALGKTVDFIEDIAGPAAVERIGNLQDGEILLLDNLRYFTEEASTFEDSVKLDPAGMGRAYLVRRLAPLFDCYVNDAFSAAHRNAPSMVAFQELLPSYGGRLLIGELEALQAITEDPERPCVYMLGGSRAGDAFGMIQQVLSDNSADAILTSGLVGQVFMLANGLSLGKASERMIKEKGYGRYIDEAAGYLIRHRNKIVYPRDVAFERHGRREEVQVDALPQDEMIFDIGKDTVSLFASEIEHSKTIFVNGPVGIYEDDISSMGTRNLWKAVEEANGFTVIGGGDTVTSFEKFTDTSKLNYVSTAGGALIQYLSGVRLPLLEAMGKHRTGLN
jgi:phosphoglycerate kinase